MDYDKNAPIHSLVKRKAVNKKQKQEKMHLFVTLLTFGDVNIDQCNVEGHTALHIAVMVSKSLTTCLKTLHMGLQQSVYYTEEKRKRFHVRKVYRH